MPNFSPFRLLKIALLVIILVIQSCKPRESFSYYYYQLGKLECENSTLLEKRMRLIEQGKENSTQYDSLGLELNKSLGNYDLFIEKHWNNDKEIAKQFTKEKGDSDRLKGYINCNCDTCYFKIKKQ